jgi:hypothetical protein
LNHGAIVAKLDISRLVSDERRGTTSLPILDAVDRQYSDGFLALWPKALAWVEPYYDGHHLWHTAKWVLRLDADASEPLLLAALTHDIERHFPGGTQPDKAAGAWDDVEYNRRHAERSAGFVTRWLREQGAADDFVAAVEPPILVHEFGGGPEGDLIQAADSLSFLEVNGSLVSSWVLNGETSLDRAIEKLDWMLDRIQIERARELAQPIHEQAVAAVRADVAAARAAAR